MNNQNVNSLLTGLADGLNKYMGLRIENNMQQQRDKQKAATELESGKQLASYKADLDLKNLKETEVYKLTLEGKVDPNTAASAYPESAQMVTDFEKKNGRPPTVNEFDKMTTGLRDKAKAKGQDNLEKQRINRFVNQHAKWLTDKGMPKLIGAYNEIASEFMTKKDVPGIGLVDSFKPNWYVSAFEGPQGVRNRSNFQQIANVLLQQQSGTAVTDPEYRRFLEQLQSGKMPDEASIRVHGSKIGQDLQSMIATAESGLDEDALQEYYSRKNAIKSGDVKLFDFNKQANEPSTATKGPAIGTVQQGYEFMGGNPADPKSWRKK